MAANIFALLFLILITWLLYRYRFRSEVHPSQLRKEVPLLGIIVLFFIANAVFALAGYLSLRSAATSQSVQYASVLEETPSGRFVVVSGAVSHSNKAVYADYVAYVDDMALWAPSGIIIDLKRGTAIVSNDDFSARGWPVDASDYAYLKPGQLVTVAGQVERSKGMFGEDRGREFVSIHADVVMAGDPEQFASHARWKSAFAGTLTVINLAGALAVLVLAIRLLLRFRKTMVSKSGSG